MLNNRIVIAGVCGSGKSTLKAGLRRLGFDAYTVAQEHSYAPRMWSMSNPRVLIFLDCDLEVIKRRRRIQWGEEHLAVQRQRLIHARQNCHLFIDTTNLSIEQVLEKASTYLVEHFRRSGNEHNTGQG